MDYQLGPGPLQVDQNTIDEKIKGDIGIVENGDVAIHAIPKGYYVIWKGDLYVSKTDISSGTTLGTSNLTAKPNGLGAEVAALNSNLDQFLYAPTTTYDGDLNDLRTPGWYVLGKNATNTPPSMSQGKLKVEYGGSSNYTRQTYYGGYNLVVATRVRLYYNGQWMWTSWVELTNNNIYLQDVSSFITGAASNEFMRLYVVNHVKLAILQYRLKGNTSITNGGTICTIPTTYRPSENIDTFGTCWLTSGATSGVTVAFTCRVSSSGSLYALHPLNQAMYGHSGIAIWKFA